SHILNNAHDVLDFSGSRVTLSTSDINLTTQYAGNGYGIPEDYHLDTIKFLATHEGIFLDPVYTSKAFTRLIMDIQSNVIKKGEKVLYIHTGGIPGIFAYPQYF